MTKHTPGPWSISRDVMTSKTDIVAPDRSDLPVARILRASPEPDGNAHLIAAAPELLEALKGLLLGHPTDGHGQYRDDRGELVKETQCLACAFARAAIRKAEGK